MRNMFWYIDIGNSSISVARGTGHELRFFREFNDNNIPKLVSLIASYGRQFNNTVVICSVVPKIEKMVCSQLKRYKTLKFKCLGKDVPIKIASKYLSFQQLGNDRKVNVYAALKRWEPPFLILDFGTATTIDYVSSKRVFEGGLIVPGGQIMPRSFA